MSSFIRFLKSSWNVFRFHNTLKQKYPTCSFEDSINIKGPLANLILGKNVQIQFNSVLHLGGMSWCQNKGKLEIGDHSCISPHCVIYAAGPGGVIIGNHFDCGPGVKIFSSQTVKNHLDSYLFKSVVIGNNVTLYANVIISPGVKIGDNSIVYAGSVVTNDIPPNSVYAGVPAKYIKSVE